jgi:hypothetical protein
MSAKIVPPQSVSPHKNVTKVVWYILVQLDSLKNTISLVSGVSVQVSGKIACCWGTGGREARKLSPL